MASTRLTNSIRDSLMEALMRRAFKAMCDDWLKRAGAFTVKVHRDIYGDDLARLQELPDGWVPKTTEIRVRIATDNVTLRTTGAWNVGGSYNSIMGDAFKACDASKAEAVQLRLTYTHHNIVAKVYDARNPIADEYNALLNEKRDLDDKIDSGRRTARAALDSVHTIQKLIEVWPEVEVFAKEYLVHGERKALLPDIPRAALNAVLGLPPSEGKAE